MRDLKFSSITFLLSFIVGVSSFVGIDKSLGNTSHFYILAAFEIAFEFAYTTAYQIISSSFSFKRGC
jgi:hypothetical protein